MITTPRATSVTREGQPDGFETLLGWWPETRRGGDTRLVVSAPIDRLPSVHAALLSALAGPVSVLYRQVVDRRAPRPEGAPPRDHVALELPSDEVLGALTAFPGVCYHDARAEIWLRGRLGEQVVLDGDGLIYCYPDDPAFRDALRGAGVPEGEVETLAARDYVKHWFHAEHDVQEDGFLERLGLQSLA